MLDDVDPSRSVLGKVITFYSYKGGVGRSMALANIGVLLARQKHRVLLLDWDLEAPGLETYFGDSNKGIQSDLEFSPSTCPGLIDILQSVKTTQHIQWQDCLNRVQFSGGNMDLISAGMRDKNYTRRLRNLDWDILYHKHHIGDFIDEFRNSIKRSYDFILVDSRTGITDIGDVCTVILPDILVTLFASNRQSIDGCSDVVDRARAARQKLPVNRGQLVVVPVAARDESASEYEQATRWRRTFSNKFEGLLREWLPESISSSVYFDRYYIPYIPNWSFGERVPVLESPRETSDPKTIGASYLALAKLLERNLEWYSRTNDESEDDFNDVRTRDMRLRTIEDDYARLQLEKSDQEAELVGIKAILADSEVRTGYIEKSASVARRYSLLVAVIAVLISTLGMGWTYVTNNTIQWEEEVRLQTLASQLSELSNVLALENARSANVEAEIAELNRQLQRALSNNEVLQREILRLTNSLGQESSQEN